MLQTEVGNGNPHAKPGDAIDVRPLSAGIVTSAVGDFLVYLEETPKSAKIIVQKAMLACIAAKPNVYSWRQLCGAGALGGIGFTMSLFIAGVAFPDAVDYAAAKIAIFLA